MKPDIKEQHVGPLRAGAVFFDSVSDSESQMDLSGFFALGAAGFLVLGAASVDFLAAASNQSPASEQPGVCGISTAPSAGRSATLPFFAAVSLSNAELLEYVENTGPPSSLSDLDPSAKQQQSFFCRCEDTTGTFHLSGLRASTQHPGTTSPI